MNTRTRTALVNSALSLGIAIALLAAAGGISAGWTRALVVPTAMAARVI